MESAIMSALRTPCVASPSVWHRPGAADEPATPDTQHSSAQPSSTAAPPAAEGAASSGPAGESSGMPGDGGTRSGCGLGGNADVAVARAGLLHHMGQHQV